jgi:hypothetical protein
VHVIVSDQHSEALTHEVMLQVIEGVAIVIFYLYQTTSSTVCAFLRSRVFVAIAAP